MTIVVPFGAGSVTDILARIFAEDMGRIEATGEAVRVPAGRFTDCVRTRDWSRIEPGVEQKWYARGVGFVRSRAGDSETCELLSVKRP